MLVKIVSAALLLMASVAAAADPLPSEASPTSISDGSMSMLDGLPWDDLRSILSPSASLVDVSYDDYVKDCLPEFVDYTYVERTAHALINQPSGLCLPNLWCGWGTCYPRPSTNGHSNETLSQFRQDFDNAFWADMFGTTIHELFDQANPDSFLYDESNPSINLPSKVLFPVVASDVIAAVEFSEVHKVEISIKNSGHHYGMYSS